SGSGSDAGPLSTSPVERSNREPWQGHSSSPEPGSTAHPWWVHTDENARISFSVGRVSRMASPAAVVAAIAPPTGTSSREAIAPPPAPPSGPSVPPEVPLSVAGGAPPSSGPHAARVSAPAVAPPAASTARRVRQVCADEEHRCWVVAIPENSSAVS